MRAPIFYALTPVLLGISVNSITDSSYGSLLISTLLISAGVILGKQNRVISFFDERIIIGMIFGGILSVNISTIHYTNVNYDVVPNNLRMMPPRELNVCIKVKKVNTYYNNKKERRITYAGIITEAPQVRADLVGRSIFCSNSRKKISNITAGKKIEVRGIIKYNEMESVGKHKEYVRADYIVFHEQILNIVENNGIEAFRNYIRDLVSDNKYISKACGGFLWAFIFGNKELLAPQQLSLFQNTGTMHLFAVSGLHIGIAFLTTLKMLNIFIIKRFVLFPVCLGIILFYVILVACPVSACRAFLMIFIWRLSGFLFRKSNPLSALGWSALLLLSVMPEQMFSIGFQLSFTVVLSILWTMGNQSKVRGFSLIHYFKISFIISYAAFGGSLLLVVDHFHFINPISVLLNGILMVFITIVFVASFTYIIVHAIYPSQFISQAIDYIYTVIEKTVLFFNSFQFTHLYFDSKFDVPDGFHLLWVFVLLSTINLFGRLWCKLVFLTCLPTCFLLLTLCCH
jgi:ComEC/Rec2-related protein